MCDGKSAIVQVICKQIIDCGVVHLLYHLLIHTVQCRGVPAHPTGCGLQGLYNVPIRSLSGAMQFVDTPHLAEGGLAALGGGCILQTTVDSSTIARLHCVRRIPLH